MILTIILLTIISTNQNLPNTIKEERFFNQCQIINFKSQLNKLYQINLVIALVDHIKINSCRLNPINSDQLTIIIIPKNKQTILIRKDNAPKSNLTDLGL